jgi:hypothetical protein
MTLDTNIVKMKVVTSGVPWFHFDQGAIFRITAAPLYPTEE